MINKVTTDKKRPKTNRPIRQMYVIFWLWSEINSHIILILTRTLKLLGYVKYKSRNIFMQVLPTYRSCWTVTKPMNEYKYSNVLKLSFIWFAYVKNCKMSDVNLSIKVKY